LYRRLCCGELRERETYGKPRERETYGKLRERETYEKLRESETYGKLRGRETYGKLRERETYGKARRDFRLLTQLNRIFPSNVLLHGISYRETHVLPDILSLEEEMNWWARNVGFKAPYAA
jgi:hypothetical protein